MTAYTHSTFRNTPFNLAAADALTVMDQGAIYIGTLNAAAILGAGGNVLSLNGFIASTDIGGAAVRLNSGNNSVTAGSAAIMSGGAAGIDVDGGSNSIANMGTIGAHDYGVHCGEGNNSIFNRGTISGGTIGVYTEGTATGALTNAGLIWSLGEAIF
jgi:hypothetical protein